MAVCRIAIFKARGKLSLAAALAKELRIPLVTGDREFKLLGKEIKGIGLP